MMGKNFLFVLFLFTVMTSAAQVRDSVSVQFNYNVGRVYGKIIDSKSNKGVEAASVQVFIITNDSLSGKQTDSLIEW
jgi:hypothetical protein